MMAANKTKATAAGEALDALRLETGAALGAARTAAEEAGEDWASLSAEAQKPWYEKTKDYPEVSEARGKYEEAEARANSDIQAFEETKTEFQAAQDAARREPLTAEENILIHQNPYQTEQGSLAKATTDIAAVFVEAYWEAIWSTLTLQEMLKFLNRFPAAGFLASILKAAVGYCPQKPLLQPSPFNFLKASYLPISIESGFDSNVISISFENTNLYFIY